MKRKGFTLIELLGVIVIIGVVGAIIVPLVLNNIEKAKEQSFKDSVLNGYTSIEYYLLENNLGDIPEEGVSIKELNLKNDNFKYGEFRKKENGKVEAVNISDGTYCAIGEVEN